MFDYEMEEEEMVKKDTIIVDGKEYKVDMVRKDGVTYIKARDIADMVGYQICGPGKGVCVGEEVIVLLRLGK